MSPAPHTHHGAQMGFSPTHVALPVPVSGRAQDSSWVPPSLPSIPPTSSPSPSERPWLPRTLRTVSALPYDWQGCAPLQPHFSPLGAPAPRDHACPWLSSLAVPAFAHAAPSARHRLSPPSFLLPIPIYPQGLCSETPLQQAPFPGWNKHRLWAPTASRPSPILALTPQPVHTPPAPSPALTTLGDLCLRSSRGTWDCSSFTPLHTCHTFDTPNSKSRTRLVLLPSLCSCSVPWLGCPSDLPGILPSPLTAPPPSDGMVLTADQWRKDARRAGWHSVPPSE